MTGSGVPLSIVPSGTGNLLARNLYLPLDNRMAMVRAAFEGDTHPIDVGWAEFYRADGTREERAFVVMGGIGLDAAMIANTSGDLKKRVGWIAYVDGAARSLPKARAFRVMYQLPEHRLHSARVQSVLFANCGSCRPGSTSSPRRPSRTGSSTSSSSNPRVRSGGCSCGDGGLGQQRAAALPRRPPGARSPNEEQLGGVLPRLGSRRRHHARPAGAARRRRVRRGSAREHTRLALAA
jgi:hypothetical protein